MPHHRVPLMRHEALACQCYDIVRQEFDAMVEDN
jgi:hypothetical protein